MNASRNFGTALLLGIVGAVVGALLVTLLAVFVLPGGLGGGSAGGAVQSAQSSQGDPSQGVSRGEAGETAVEHLGEGEVTWTSREDDYGAAWEIEVTGPDGESNVYVAADGQVTHVSGAGSGAGQSADAGSGDGQQPAPEPAPAPAQPQPVDDQRAGEIAIEHLGEGEVTWISREDDYGALWEIEVTGSDGSESNVYVNAAGEVTHVE